MCMGDAVSLASKNLQVRIQAISQDWPKAFRWKAQIHIENNIVFKFLILEIASTN